MPLRPSFHPLGTPESYVFLCGGVQRKEDALKTGEILVKKGETLTDNLESHILL